MLSDVCLSRTSGLSREQRLKTKIGTEVAHVTRDSGTTFKVKRSESRSPGRFTHRGVIASGSCSGERGNVLAVGTYCLLLRCGLHFAGAATRRRDALRRPQREERGGGILWRQPAYSLFFLRFLS